MIPDRLAWSVALRGLVGSRSLTALTMIVVSVSALLVIFLSALIAGLRVDLTAQTTGAIPHIELRPRDRLPPPPAAWSTGDGELVLGQRSPTASRRSRIDDWHRWQRFLEAYDPQVIAVSPVVAGQVFAQRGGRERAVRALGVEPERYDAIVGIEAQLEAGRFRLLGPGEVAVGIGLADDFGLAVGDRLQLQSTGGARSARIAGIYDTGFGALDDGTVLMPLGDGQALLELGGAVTSIAVTVDDVFAAPALAARMQRQTPHEVRDWTQDNQRLLDGLDAQGRSSQMITGFTALAAAFAVASILIVLVTNKLREIGILKAMGATRRQIRAIFAIQGTVLAGAGGVLGSAAGVALVLGLSRITVVSAAGRATPIFPFALSAELVLGVIAVSTLLGFTASLIPARRASRIDAIEVIRG